MPEFFKDVPGFPNYMVSVTGLIYSKPRRSVPIGRKGSHLCGGAFKVPQTTPAGHLACSLMRSKQSVNRRVGAWVLDAFVGTKPDGMECCHVDGDPLNNAIGNLRWDTHASNMADSSRHGTHVRGEQHPSAKLTEEQVIYIRRMRTGGTPARELAETYGVCVDTIRSAANGRKWSYLSQ